jgi:hypothetical protein
VIDEDRLFGGNRLAGFDVSLQPGSLVSVHLDDFNGDPMILNLPDFRQADRDTRTAVVQPQTDFDKITGNQLIRRSHLGAGFIDSQHAAVCLKLPMYAGEHAVDREIRNGPTGQLLSYRHKVTLE